MPPPSQRDDSVARAGRIGLGIPPLQLYSIYLVARLVPCWRCLSSGDRRRVVVAALLNVWLPFMVTAIGLYVWLRA